MDVQGHGGAGKSDRWLGATLISRIRHHRSGSLEFGSWHGVTSREDRQMAGGTPDRRVLGRVDDRARANIIARRAAAA
ncbi:hypothetical protein C0Z18_10950 [Trinickia dabaoshanensis]|uniref:Uncharacterized protein n=1 Tax=Trinickia dabaoshanensis TaxID=564714 RepID=A0A2N7VTJ5_9BURK|nr:hypothetical protein C0Z18_10950 [Trinickia dabaoshanensis]